MHVGTTKEQGLYNRPSAAVHPGALAAGTLPQYNTSLSTVAVSTLMTGKSSNLKLSSHRYFDSRNQTENSQLD